MTAALATGPRDIRDARRLTELETVIERGKSAFIEVGEALLEVRDSRLYRLNYPTFEAYCKGRWGFTPQHGRRLMDAASVARQMEPIGAIPTTESQARELAPVLREHGPEVAAQVMADASADGPATAETIRTAAAPFRPRLAPSDPYFSGTPVPETPIPEAEEDANDEPDNLGDHLDAFYVKALREYVAGVVNVLPSGFVLKSPPSLFRKRHALARALDRAIDEVLGL